MNMPWPKVGTSLNHYRAKIYINRKEQRKKKPKTSECHKEKRDRDDKKNDFYLYMYVFNLFIIDYKWPHVFTIKINIIFVV